ncbi:hypothetical protein HP1_043 [Candidatus Termititenax spirochaetophilus]|uniref:Uncharacterized protein n=1 Tax=Candidatus Termititenax spirochaetophilus TaxID=2218522 RepID=A0A388T6H8_9BACT|nr:hypothetical protein HP1_043 [Candidatus Termititenax spirochaetophilus]
MGRWSAEAAQGRVKTDWQYPEKQQKEFEEIYPQYPNWREYKKQMGF